MLVKNKLDISCWYSENEFGIQPGFGGKYKVSYPKGVFNSLDDDGKKILAKNFTYTRTRPLTMVADRLVYKFSKPNCKELVDYGVVGDLPRISDFIKRDTQDLTNVICDPAKITFTGQNKPEKLLPQRDTSNKKAILALSFGKDSLLCYALLKEIGFDFQIVFGVEMESQNSGEYEFKNRIMKSFADEQGEEILLFKDTVDEMYYAPVTDGLGEFENTNGMLAFALELIPFAFNHGAKYIVFGNEKNMDDSYINAYGTQAYPSFDQSSVYTQRENKQLANFTSNSIQVMSLVEPIYNLAEMKILNNRYPHLLKYMMSCSPDEGSRSRWCYSCPMCAKSFLYLKAVGGDPRKIAFEEDFFRREYTELYPPFARNIKRPYEKPPTVREEQLLAFLMAYQLGAKGDLITIFEQKFLQEAMIKEKDLRRQFLGIHVGPSIPKTLRRKIIPIYEEELFPLYAQD
mgnify:CR=1 FL=1